MSMISTATTSPEGRRAVSRSPRPAAAPIVVTAQPSSPTGVTIGSAGRSSAAALIGVLRTADAVDAAVSGGCERSGVIVTANRPMSSRLIAAVVAIRTRPLVVVGSCSGGPSSEGCRHGRSCGGRGARSTSAQRSDTAPGAGVATGGRLAGGQGYDAARAPARDR